MTNLTPLRYGCTYQTQSNYYTEVKYNEYAML